jgi:hypothetical protein
VPVPDGQAGFGKEDMGGKVREGDLGGNVPEFIE